MFKLEKLKIRRLSTKIILLVLAIMVTSLVFVLWYQGSTFRETYFHKEIDRSRALTTFCEEIRVFISGFRNSKVFHDKDLLSDAREEMDAGKKYSETKLYLTIPVVSAWTAAEEKASDLGYEFRVPRNHPRNPEHKPRAGVEQAVVDYLEGRGEIEDIEHAGGEILYPKDKYQAREMGEIGLLHTG
ncbi:DUF3365 domain-containing protein, partial [Desulfobacterales bacterium HSG2]|nr:DUF3365 domain-containing protein [Desulfobacterales bacterium HSG2]